MGGRSAAGWWALPAAGAVLCAVAISVSVSPVRVVTTYSMTSASAAIADVTAGVALVVASAVALARPRSRTWGVLLGLLALAWLAHDVVGWRDGPDWARSVGMVLVPFVLPLVAHLAPAARPVVAAGYTAAGLYSGGRALFRDPFHDVACWSNCAVNSFQVRHLPTVVAVLDAVWSPVIVGLGVAVVASCLLRLRGASAVGRRSLLPVLAGVAAAALSIAARQALLWIEPAEDPRSPWFVGAFLLQAAGVTALAVGATAGVLRAAATRRALARLEEVLRLRPEPGAVSATLARALGDPGLRVAYWLPDRGAHVDGAGRPVDPTAGPGQVETVLLRGGRRVAVVIHDRGVSIAPDLEREIGAAARLALDNERLRAGVLAHLADLQAARGRIVDAADDTRRRIERDLHDGAQQRLLAVSAELRLAASGAAQPHRAAVDDAAATVRAASTELRTLAHGIFPAVLADSGLGAGLRALAARAPLPVELHGELDGGPDGGVGGRLPARAEVAGYVVVAEAADRADRSGATHLVAGLSVDGEALVVTTEDDGHGGNGDALVSVTDRVGALGGTIEVTGRRVRAVIPCA